MSKVSNTRIPEEEFLQMRRETLSAWPTGKEVDFDEAVEYLKKLPEDRYFGKILANYKKEGKLGLYRMEVFIQPLHKIFRGLSYRSAGGSPPDT